MITGLSKAERGLDRIMGRQMSGPGMPDYYGNPDLRS